MTKPRYSLLTEWISEAELLEKPLAERIRYVRMNLASPNPRARKPYINHDDFAALVGVVNRKTVSRWEKADTTPEPENAEAIAALTDYRSECFQPPEDAAELHQVRRELDRLNARVAAIEARARA